MDKKYYKKIGSAEIDALLGKLCAAENSIADIKGQDELVIYKNKEIGKVLGINEKLLRRYRYDGKLAYTKVGDKYWYTQHDIDEFMAKYHREAFA